MRVVIMGCGRVGAALAIELDAAGCDVVVIDRDPESFDRLPVGFAGRTVTGAGFDRGVLEKAGTREATAFAAVSSGTTRTSSPRGSPARRSTSSA